MSLFYDKQPILAVAEALPYYSDKEFNSPTRSTVPLLSLLAHAPLHWPSIAGVCAPREQARELRLEYTVDPPRGSGRPSHTDAMLLTRRNAFAIEAKWTEPRYATVLQWIADADSSGNRQAVMRGWLNLLQPWADRQLELQNFSDAVYQMVHRAASACTMGRSPCLVYLQFCPMPNGAQSNTEQLRHDLAHLHALLGTPRRFRFYLVEVQLGWPREFEQVRVLPKGLATTGSAVRAALMAGPLFEVIATKVRRIPAYREHAMGAEAR